MVSGRPLLGDDPAEALTDLEAVRNPFYDEVADVIIDVDELTPAAVAQRIIDAMDATADADRRRRRRRRRAPSAPSAPSKAE